MTRYKVWWDIGKGAIVNGVYIPHRQGYGGFFKNKDDARHSACLALYNNQAHIVHIQTEQQYKSNSDVSDVMTMARGVFRYKANLNSPKNRNNSSPLWSVDFDTGKLVKVIKRYDDWRDY